MSDVTRIFDATSEGQPCTCRCRARNWPRISRMARISRHGQENPCYPCYPWLTPSLAATATIWPLTVSGASAG